MYTGFKQALLKKYAMGNEAMKILLVAICFCFSGAAIGSDIKMPVKLDAEGFQGVLADAGKVFISGQPSEEGLRRLKAEGMTTIINFRTKAEMDNRERVPFDEVAIAKSMGLVYISIPLGDEEHPYSPDALATFAEAMQNTKGKALIHCTVAWRASHMWAAYLAKYEGMEINDAVAHGRAANMSTQPMESLLGGKVTYSLKDQESP